MKVWANTAFIGHYPVGTAAIVVADTAIQAQEMLNAALMERGLQPSAKAKDFTRVPTGKPLVQILHDGNY